MPGSGVRDGTDVSFGETDIGAALGVATDVSAVAINVGTRGARMEIVVCAG